MAEYIRRAEKLLADIDVDYWMTPRENKNQLMALEAIANILLQIEENTRGQAKS